MHNKVKKTDEEWRTQLTDAQYAVCRMKATERPFTGKYNDCKDAGTYHCVCCGVDLFSSETKFESGSGWPSFWEPVTKDSVHFESDAGYGMVRTEVLCNTCGAHLGHVFEDGPPPTGLRYCMNSVALQLKKAA